MLLLAANVLTTGGAYLYNLLCIRWLGAARFGDVAAVTALGAILAVPFLGVQAMLARDVARLHSQEDHGAIRALLSTSLRRALPVQIGLVVVMVIAAPLLERALNLSSTGVALMAAVLVGSSILLPILQGFLQGLHRFRA